MSWVRDHSKHVKTIGSTNIDYPVEPGCENPPCVQHKNQSSDDNTHPRERRELSSDIAPLSGLPYTNKATGRNILANEVEV
jgi:hypothetical protein